jgi:hypothetical protein
VAECFSCGCGEDGGEKEGKGINVLDKEYLLRRGMGVNGLEEDGEDIGDDGAADLPSIE